ncbi:LAQU0S10e00738g1_1 [Lachancea quebecensis]|uniref:LAQU0S10e00738g1_1 n=1 Tax=Lachancea quebecensis TaxID=1654605 RepID=A0A0P1KU07_9SACH|nr:LAQU0S10e00738g1_1 [Lachancea quebecensis]
MRVTGLIWLFALTGLANCLKWDEIGDLRDEDGVIEVTESNYKMLSQGLREFYSILYVTTSAPASGGVVCELCNVFEVNVRKASKAMQLQLPEDVNREAVFFKLDVSQCTSFVKEIGLKTIPHMLIYPPPKDEDSFAWSKSVFYQFQITPESAKDPVQFADFLAKILNVYFGVARDFDKEEFLQYFVVSLVCFFVLKKKILPLIPHKAWFFSLVFSLGILLASITGLKFTQINNIPLLAKDEKGNIMFFSGGMAWQFGIEIFSVSAMYIAMGCSVVALIFIPRVRQLDPFFSNVAALAVLALGFYVFAYFTSCFKVKDPGYPFAVL